MNLKKVAVTLSLALAFIFNLYAQQPAPTSGDVTVRLAEPLDFATARPLQAVRSVVATSTNPAIPAGSLAVLQLQNRDGSYALKLLRVNAAGQVFKTMSQPGVSVDGSTASGAHASLPNGAMVRFTLTQPDGSPGAAVQQAPAVAAPAQVSATTARSTSTSGSGTTKDRAHFEIEGVKLGQTVPELMAVAKAYSPKQTREQGLTSVSFKTSDLDFTVGFSKAGVLSRMDIFSVRKSSDAAVADLKTAATGSTVYRKAIQAYGKPEDVSSGDEAKWSSADGSSAGYWLQDDTVEVMAASN